MAGTFPPRKAVELWDLLVRQREAGEMQSVEETARQLDRELSAIPNDKAGSKTRPGIDGMLWYSVVSEVLGRSEDAIRWRSERIDLLREFLAKDPDNSLGLFSLADLHDEVVQLAGLYQRSGQSKKAEEILADWQRENR